jgi:hypothetical protein
MAENALDGGRRGQRGDDCHAAMAARAFEHVLQEDAPDERCPGVSPPERRLSRLLRRRPRQRRAVAIAARAAGDDGGTRGERLPLIRNRVSACSGLQRTGTGCDSRSGESARSRRLRSSGRTGCVGPTRRSPCRLASRGTPSQPRLATSRSPSQLATTPSPKQWPAPEHTRSKRTSTRGSSAGVPRRSEMLREPLTP